MLVLNFWDAIAEGNGERILRCWKFFLMYLKHQEGSATKYSLEALYLIFQAYALLRTVCCKDHQLRSCNIDKTDFTPNFARIKA